MGMRSATLEDSTSANKAENIRFIFPDAAAGGYRPGRCLRHQHRPGAAGVVRVGRELEQMEG